MKDELPRPIHPSSFRLHPFLIVALFLAARIPLLFVRQPFFDELYTRWIAAKSFAGIVDALRYDSVPPLFSFVVHLFPSGPLLSLLFAAAAVLVILRQRLLTYSA